MRIMLSARGCCAFNWRIAIFFCALAGGPTLAPAQCHFPTDTHRNIVTYRFQPETTPAGLVVHVAFTFRMGADGTQTLILPDEWAGKTLRATRNLHTASMGASLQDGEDAYSMTVHARPHRFVTVSYDLQKDWTGPLVNPLQFHPVVMPEYFQFTGSSALVRLKLGDEALETANFDWQKLPATWSLATSFGTTTTDRCQTYTGSWINVYLGLFAAGDYRIHPFQINHQPAFLAVRGTWTFSDDEAITDIQTVVGMVRNFWRDDAFPYFLVTLSPYDRDHGSSDGSAYTNAFWMYVSRLDSLSGLLPQLAHESFHAWDPEKMGIVPSGYDESQIKWFREGPTDYYGHLLTYRAGELSASGYINYLNIALRRFPTSNDEYVRGPIISLWLDGTIRKESNGKHSLDDVMFDMVRSGNQPYTLARILATANRYLSAESRTSLEQAAVHGGDLPMPEHLPVLGACAQASLESLSSFDLGFDFDQSNSTKTITDVVESGPAFAAGLRDGQSLLTSSFSKDDSERMARFRVHGDAGDQQINFFPRGKTVQRWQYHLDPTTQCQTS